MAVSTIQGVETKSFTYNSLHIEICVYPMNLRVAKIYTNSSISQGATGWVDVGSYNDGLASCTVVADNGLRIALRESNGKLQILIPSAINGWFLGAAVSTI